jgi:2,3-bisphosphoglycerate-independent phosphoglycerate mutase
VVLDGFGVGPGGDADATALADTPFLDRIERLYPRASLATSGPAVGLPEGQMGNSEVGHMTLGAGRVIEQDIGRIQNAIDRGELEQNPVFQDLLAEAARSGGRLHLFALVSDGGVHSSPGHLDGVLRALEARGIAPVLHAFTDGRDTPPRSAAGWIGPLEERLRRAGGGIASVCGRYWAMDRDTRWERIARAYRAIVCRSGIEVSTAIEAVEKAYGRDEGDEFIQPSVVAGARPLADHEAVLFVNFRADRARQLTNAITRVKPDAVGRELDELPRVIPSRFVTLTCYDDEFGLPMLFPPIRVERSLGELLALAGLAQLRIAETEKYAHVTYFFNGGRETPFQGEDRILVPSPTDVDTYDLKPEMSAVRVTDELISALERTAYDFVLVNYANTDMVGHTGVIPACVSAVEVVDACLDRVASAVLAAGGGLLVTSDHGNVESLVDLETGVPHTAHTTNPVPIWWVGPEDDGGSLRDGSLADVAPSVCELLGLDPAGAMTGRSLLSWPRASSSC